MKYRNMNAIGIWGFVRISIFLLGVMLLTFMGLNSVNFVSVNGASKQTEDKDIFRMLRFVNSLTNTAAKQRKKGAVKRAELIENYLVRKLEISHDENIRFKKLARNFVIKEKKLKKKTSILLPFKRLSKEQRKNQTELRKLVQERRKLFEKNRPELRKVAAQLKKLRKRYLDTVKNNFQKETVETLVKFARSKFKKGKKKKKPISRGTASTTTFQKTSHQVYQELELYYYPEVDMDAGSWIDYDSDSSEVYGGSYTFGQCMYWDGEDFYEIDCETVEVEGLIGEENQSPLMTEFNDEIPMAEVFELVGTVSNTGSYCVDGYHLVIDPDYYEFEDWTQDCVEILPQILIKRDITQDITSTTQNPNIQNVIVGQRMNLSVETVGTATSLEWEIPNDSAIENFVTSPAGRKPTKGKVEQVSGLDTDSISFVWYVGGTPAAIRKEVTVTATINGISVSATAKFDVIKPATTLTTTQTGTTNVLYYPADTDPTYPNANDGVLLLDNTARTGMIFARGATTIPSPFAGKFQFVQLVNGQMTRTPDPPNSSPTWNGLDTCYPYTLSEVQMQDNPTIGLSDVSTMRYLDYARFNVEFEVFLMFQPTGTGSSWVPLKKLEWKWDGEATRVPNSNPVRWTPNALHNPGLPTSTDTTTFPVWTSLEESSNSACID